MILIPYGRGYFPAMGSSRLFESLEILRCLQSSFQAYLKVTETWCNEPLYTEKREERFALKYIFNKRTQGNPQSHYSLLFSSN